MPGDSHATRNRAHAEYLDLNLDGRIWTFRNIGRTWTFGQIRDPEDPGPLGPVHVPEDPGPSDVPEGLGPSVQVQVQVLRMRTVSCGM